MWRSFLVLNLALLAISALAACDGIASAQRIDDNPEPSQRAPVVESMPISVGRTALRNPLWTLDAPDYRLRGDPDNVVVGDGAVFLGDRYGTGSSLTALDEHTGKPRWRSEVDATPLAFGAGLVFGATRPRQFEKGRVVAIDAHTGTTRWATAGGWMTLERQLAIVVNGSRLEAHDADTGRLRWSSVWDSYFPQRADLIGTTLLLRTNEGGATIVGILYAYDIRDGRPLWTTRANAIVGLLPNNEIALDTTWEPGAFAGFAPLTVTVVGLANGAPQSSHSYAPDRGRWTGQSDHNAHFAADVAVDSDTLVFRLGTGTVYRYSRDADPITMPGTSYELGPVTLVAPRLWLVRRPSGVAAFARLTDANATLQTLAGFDGVTFTAADGGLAFVASGERAAVLNPEDPGAATVTRSPCMAVRSAVIADGAFVAVCSAPAKLVALALPTDYTPSVLPTAIPLRASAPDQFTAEMHSYEVPTRGMMLGGTAFSSDGSLWFYEHRFFVPRPGAVPEKDEIGHLKADGTIEEFPIPAAQRDPGSIVRGPDGAMWFTETTAVKLGRISSDGAIREYELPSELDRVPTFPSRSTPSPLTDVSKVPNPISRRHYQELGGLVAGSASDLWVTAPYANAIVRVTTSGAIHVFTLPNEFSFPGSIARAPDDALWFTASGAIGRITTAGVATRFPVDTKLPLTSIVWGPDGNIWYSFFDGHVGRITPAGVMKEFAAPIVAAPSGPLVGGCDGALYMADRFRPALWRVTTAGSFEQQGVDYAIGHLARAPDCKLGFSEAQMSMTSHVGTISVSGEQR